jgi:hypothetical protein
MSELSVVIYTTGCNKMCENPHVHELPLCDMKLGIWFTLRAWRLVGVYFMKKQILNIM